MQGQTGRAVSRAINKGRWLVKVMNGRDGGGQGGGVGRGSVGVGVGVGEGQGRV